MKTMNLTKLLLVSVLLHVSPFSLAEEQGEGNHHQQHKHQHKHEHKHKHHKHHALDDKRIALDLSPQMKQHQLAMMREHLASVQMIVSLMAQQDFKEAAHVAHAKLGLTDEMDEMCESVGNEEFSKLGLAFHKSADALAETLKTKNMTNSLQALDKTLNYCVQCHSTFKH